MFRIANKNVRVVLLVCLIFEFALTPAIFASPCVFHGISVGEKLSTTQVMERLGISNFKNDPENIQLRRELQNIDSSHGYIGSKEIAYWKLGPVCSENICNIPYGVKILDQIESSVEVMIEAGKVTSIRVKFNNRKWGKFTQYLKSEYGKSWKVSKEKNFAIADESGVNQFLVDRIFYQFKENAIDSESKIRCEMSATNFDSQFLHSDPIGAKQGAFTLIWNQQ